MGRVGNAAPVAAGLAIGVGFFVLLAVVVNTSISPNVPQELVVQRSEIASMLAISEARKMLGNVSVIDLDYRWLSFDRDRVTISVIGSTAYKPLYNSSGIIFTETRFPLDVWILDIHLEVQLLQDAVGFARTETQNKIITVDIDRKTNSVLSTKIDPLPDKTINIKFTEKQKKAIALVLSDGRVQELAAKHRYFIQQIRPGVGGLACSDPEGCILVGLGLMSEPKRGVHTVVIVDISTGKVLNVAPPLTSSDHSNMRRTSPSSTPEPECSLSMWLDSPSFVSKGDSQ